MLAHAACGPKKMISSRSAAPLRAPLARPVVRTSAAKQTFGSFEEMIAGSTSPVLVDFYATCGAARGAGHGPWDRVWQSGGGYCVISCHALHPTLYVRPVRPCRVRAMPDAGAHALGERSGLVTKKEGLERAWWWWWWWWWVLWRLRTAVCSGAAGLPLACLPSLCRSPPACHRSPDVCARATRVRACARRQS